MDASAWQKAVQQSRAVLKPEEQAQYALSQPHDIVRDFEKDRKRKAQTSKLERALTRIQPFVVTLERYGRPLDVLASAAPNILSPVWGTMRALLLIAKDAGGYFLGLIGMLEQIGNALPRLKVYENLFGEHRELQNALSDVYLSLIQFLVKAKELFSSSPLRLVLMATWKSFNQTFKKDLDSLKENSQRAKEEAEVAHMAEMKALVVSQKTLQQPRPSTPSAAEIAAIERWLYVRQCKEERGDIDHLPDTCQWIFSQPKLQDWIDNEDTRLFWLYGAPGCGKSYLYAKILDHLDAHPHMKCAYFFFCGADGDRVTTSALLRSWTFQLAELYPEAKKLVQDARLMSRNHEATAKELKPLFISLLRVIPPCYLTVDALDECIDRPELYKLLQLIPNRFKVLITSRPMVELSMFLCQLAVYEHTTLEIKPEMTRLDVRRYIVSTLQEPAFQHKASVAAQIEKKLSRARGNFMWVRLMFRHIRDQTTNEEIIKCLKDLPNELSERYDRIIDKINDLPKARRLLAHKVFFWITVARRPLKVKELCALLAVKPAATSISGFVRDRRVNDAQHVVLDVCGHLITARGFHNKLYPIHFTVTEYLRKYMANEARYQEIAGYYEVRQLRSDDDLAAAVCMRYSSMRFLAGLKDRLPSNHSEALAIMESDIPNLDALQYASTQWFQHLRHANRPNKLLLDLADQLLDEAQPNLAITWHLYWFSRPEPLDSATHPNSYSVVDIVSHLGLCDILRSLLIRRDPKILNRFWTVSINRAAVLYHVTTDHVQRTVELIMKIGASVFSWVRE